MAILVTTVEEQEEAAVQELGEMIGYGRIMQLAQEIWRKKGIPGGEFAIGPCVGLTVPCGCNGSCDWCNGAGWVTPKVKAFKDSLVVN